MLKVLINAMNYNRPMKHVLTETIHIMLPMARRSRSVFVFPVCADFPNSEEKLFDHVIYKITGVFPVVTGIDF
jgi:hypothetical protein